MQSQGDKVKLVPTDGSTYRPTEDPPQYYPTAHQQSVVMNPYAQQSAVNQQAYGQQQPVAMSPPYGQQQPMGYPPPMAGAPYAQPVVSQQTVVVNQQPTAQTIVLQGAAPRPPTYMWVACVVFWCCNPLFGGIAFIVSVIAASAADEGDNTHARRLGKVALWISVIGVVLSVVFIIVYVTVVVKATEKSEDTILNNDNGWHKNGY